jgi:Protein of unknown function (DUF1631)
VKQRTQILQKARADFVSDISASLPNACLAGLAALQSQANSPASHAQTEALRHARRELQDLKDAWIKATSASWKDLLDKDEVAHSRFTTLQLEIEDTSAVEHRIAASRLSTVFQDAVTGELADLRMRILHIERAPELSSFDVFQPSVFSLAWVEAWSLVGLSHSTWELCSEAMQKDFSVSLLQAYKNANASLIKARILPSIEQHKILRRDHADEISSMAHQRAMPMGYAANATLAQQAAHFRQVAGLTAPPPAGGHGWNEVLAMAGGGAAGFPPIHYPMPGLGAYGGAPMFPGMSDSSNTNAFSDPRAQARIVSNQLSNLLQDKVGFVLTGHGDEFANSGDTRSFSETRMAGVSTQAATPPLELNIPPNASPREAVELLRQYSNSLKRHASTNIEKATIEIVALIFQNILAEERITDAIRLLFARLQLPVIRVALKEPHFFESIEHPARKLIDRMGSCVLGLDPSSIASADLEAEIRRIVQVVEQFPESGSKVFGLVLEEFEDFLKRHLGGSESQQRVLGMAQQVEQKETLSVQYTIEIRNLIHDFVISDVIREFLLKIWAEVLAVCVVKFGHDSEQVQTYKKVISQLVWSGSPKPDRSERMRMIAAMPTLMQVLRDGMTLLSISEKVQEAHITSLGDAFNQAFQTKTQAIAPGRLEEMGMRLQNLEELFTDENLGDLPIDAESIELMLDMDPQAMNVITHLPVEPSDAAKHWAREMELGQWFNLQTPNGSTQVQYVWRSDLGQLHLFAHVSGKNYLFRVLSLAAHLQCGQLVPIEHEALTVRATRQALDKINANPAQLLD